MDDVYDDAAAQQSYIPIATWLTSVHPELCRYADTMSEFGYEDTFFLQGAPWLELEIAFHKCNMAIVHRRLIRSAAGLLRDNVAAAADAPAPASSPVQVSPTPTLVQCKSCKRIKVTPAPTTEGTTSAMFYTDAEKTMPYITCKHCSAVWEFQ